MKERILQVLNDLRDYALHKGLEITIYYHEEDSHLIRFANSAISLNTNEHLIRLEFTAHDGSKRASYGMITDLSSLDEMKKGIDAACDMVRYAMPLSYKPTVPVYPEPFIDESGYDEALVAMSSQEKLAFFNRVVEGLETDTLLSSGIISSGTNTLASVSTLAEHPWYVKTSDMQVSIVLAHKTLKWEVQAEQSAQQKGDLDPRKMREELEFLLKHYQEDPSLQLPLGRYNIVFGSAAIADLLHFMELIGFNGGLMKRGFSFLKEEDFGKKKFSTHFTVEDDPERRETFPFHRDLFGMTRRRFPFVENGFFKGFYWMQDDADEFGAQPTAHTVPHLSLCMAGGTTPVNTLEELSKLPHDTDLLYIPFLHYMNIVNPSNGIVTGSSRFGALLFRKDGSIAIPYNVRLTQSLLEIFGDGVEWISTGGIAYNTSQSYGPRNPTSIVVPPFIQVNNLEISHSNPTF